MSTDRPLRGHTYLVRAELWSRQYIAGAMLRQMDDLGEDRRRSSFLFLSKVLSHENAQFLVVAEPSEKLCAGRTANGAD